MSYAYSAFGLQILANIPLPGLVDSCAAMPVDVRVSLGQIPDTSAGALLYESPLKDRAGTPILRVQTLPNGSFHFEYADRISFVLNRPGSQIWAQWPEDLTVEDTCTYLFGPIFGFVLRLRGTVSLHASGIVIGGGAIALLGAAGAGKSTTAAAFARLGYRIITDDVVALIDRGRSFSVQPGYPGLRLWPDSVYSLWGSPDALPRITPTWDKRYLDLMENGYEFETGPVPLCAIYVLGERSTESRAPGIENDSDPALLQLLANTYVNYLLDKKMRAKEFDVLTRVATAVPIQRAIPHADPARLPELCRRIADDARTLLAAPVA